MTQPSLPQQLGLTKACDAFVRGNFDSVVVAIEHVAQQCSEQPVALLECARAYGHCYEIQRAEVLLEGLLPDAPANLRPRIAAAFQQIFRPEKSLEILRSLHKAGELPLPSLAQLAKLYEQSNRKAEAIAALEHCVSHAPAQPQPKVLLARLLRQSGETDQAQLLLEPITKGSSSVATMVHAWSELASVLDQLGDYEAAETAMEEAKTRLRSIPQVQQQVKKSRQVSAAFQSVYDKVESKNLKVWHEQRFTTKARECRIAHLLGFPRSGTTLLERMLGAHQTIVTAPERAVFTKAVFPSLLRNRSLSFAELDETSQEHCAELCERYLTWHESIAGCPLDHRILLDKNPNHTSLLIGLYRMCTESKFVFALRDPRDVVVSTYMRFFSLSEFSASYLSWESTCDLYAHEMNVWLKMRAMLPANWIEVKYEDVVADETLATRRVVEFLDVEWSAEMLKSRDEIAFVNSPTHAEVRKPIYDTSIGRWRNYERFIAPWMPKLAPFIEAFGYQ